MKPYHLAKHAVLTDEYAVTYSDRERARSVGRDWANRLSDVGLTDVEVMALANSTDEISEALDAIAVDRGECLYGHRQNFSPDELHVLRFYLARLTWEASRAIENVAVARRYGPQRFGRPVELPHGVSFKGAELLVQEWMQHLGVTDARTTAFSNDGGVDVDSATHIAQVKHQFGTVGRPEIQALYGIAKSTCKEALFFSSSSYTKSALEWANLPQVQMCLFRFNAESGALTAVNDVAGRFLAQRM